MLAVETATEAARDLPAAAPIEAALVRGGGRSGATCEGAFATSPKMDPAADHAKRSSKAPPTGLVTDFVATAAGGALKAIVIAAAGPGEAAAPEKSPKSESSEASKLVVDVALTRGASPDPGRRGGGSATRRIVSNAASETSAPACAIATCAGRGSTLSTETSSRHAQVLTRRRATTNRSYPMLPAPEASARAHTRLTTARGWPNEARKMRASAASTVRAPSRHLSKSSLYASATSAGGLQVSILASSGDFAM